MITLCRRQQLVTNRNIIYIEIKKYVFKHMNNIN